MKKKYIILSAFIFISVSVRAQKKDTVFRKDTIRKTDIEIMYSQYMQDGNNSAVTGGIGTEKLMVYSPAFKIRNTGRNNRSTIIKGGVDVISSASTDHIDYVVSSASIIDTRAYANIIQSFPIKKKGLEVYGGTGFSIESDYFSIPLNLGFRFMGKNKMRAYSMNLQMYYDDLRWGRITEGYWRPVELVYPVELRFKDWYDTYKRKSYNFQFGLQQILNKRNWIGIYPEFTYQHGLLATPFHRVYFKDSSLKVENLPEKRFKFLMGFRANSFVGGRVILKNQLDLYTDNFGISGIAFENETAVKLNYKLTLSPFIRIFRQRGSKYFAPYREHSMNEIYYTSDYDLSTFNTYKAGVNMRYAPYNYLRKNVMFNEIQLRYAFYYRSNGLEAHILTCVFNGMFIRKK